jgi:hypothetical protein
VSFGLRVLYATLHQRRGNKNSMNMELMILILLPILVGIE